LLASRNRSALAAAWPAPLDGIVMATPRNTQRGRAQLDGIVTGLRFGKFAREDNTLVLVMKSGGLSIKILPRTSSLEKVGSSTGPPPEQDIPLAVPKKTKLYVEQTQRERDQGIDIHRVFQACRRSVRARCCRRHWSAHVHSAGPTRASAWPISLRVARALIPEVYRWDCRLSTVCAARPLQAAARNSARVRQGADGRAGSAFVHRRLLPPPQCAGEAAYVSCAARRPPNAAARSAMCAHAFACVRWVSKSR
jgi:hypothetical protein